jgi:pyruvate-formate lyase-activating enzyme
VQPLSNSIKSLEPQIDPNNKITFLLDWELTLKCNLDCSYCESGPTGSHDNSTKHPPLSECLDAIDFMFEYVDVKMQNKPKGLKYVVLNVYGGESLHHPNVVQVLQNAREKYKPYQDKWHLIVTTTTNAIVSSKKLAQIIPLIDEFTVSYHSENTDAQKQQFRRNLLAIKASTARLKCVVMMHGEPDKFADSQQMIQWLEQNHIKCLPKQVDNPWQNDDFNYNKQQVVWFENLYKTSLSHAEVKGDKSVLSNTGRACCGGRMMCADQQFKQTQYFVPNHFKGWYCSVNHFFLHIKQVTKQVFVNKDCRMNFNGTHGPIGTLNDTKSLIQQASNPAVIQCANTRCYCGLCAPKSSDLDTYKKMMEKYEISPVNVPN